MPRPAAIPCLAVCAALVFSLAACTTGSVEAPPPTPMKPAATASEPSPSSTPLFTTEEEALAAAKTAYAAYLQVVDDIGRDGGSGIERMRAVTTGEAREIDMKDLTRYSEKDAHATGETIFDSVSIERWDPQDSAVSIYVCDDISDVDVVNSSGASIVMEGREDRLAFVADFEANGGRLLLARKYRWIGDNYCD